MLRVIQKIFANGRLDCPATSWDYPRLQPATALPEECLAALRQHKARQAKAKLFLRQAYQEHGLI
jgi:hypothetical protein